MKVLEILSYSLKVFEKSSCKLYIIISNIIGDKRCCLVSRKVDEILSNIEKRIEAIESRLERIERVLSVSEVPGSFELTHPGIERVPRMYQVRSFLTATSELTPTEREVLRIIEKKRKITASELAELLGISTSSATRYLRGLYRLGFIGREEKRRKSGKEVVYIAKNV